MLLTVVRRRLLRVLQIARISNESILKEISPEYSLEGLMLKLKLQCFSHLMWKADSFEKTLMLGKIEGRRSRWWRGWDGWMASLTQWTWIWVNSSSCSWTGRPGVLQSMGSQRVGLNDWNELNWACFLNRDVFVSDMSRSDFFPLALQLNWISNHLSPSAIRQVLEKEWDSSLEARYEDLGSANDSQYFSRVWRSSLVWDSLLNC